MGVTYQTFEYFQKWFNKEKHHSICELGDQQFMCCFPYVEYTYTRTYFKGLKKDYDSIDLNGLDNSLMLDLNTEIEIKRQYDIITDFGTLEHVSDYYMGFKNTHRLCKVGGLMIHVIPAINHWPGHGSWRGDRSFYVKLGKYQNYTIRDIHTEPTKISPGHPSDQIYIVYEKTEENEFMSRDTFNSYGPVCINDPEVYLPGKVGGGRNLDREKS
jgi:hypothetical protein